MNYIVAPELIKCIIVSIIFISFYLGIDKGINRLVTRIDDNNKKMVEKIGKIVNQYVFFLIFFLYGMNFIVDIQLFVTVLVLVVITLMFIFKKQITSFVVGIYRIMNNVMVVNDRVVINNEHIGTVREVTLNTVKVFKGYNAVVTIPHSEIKTIEKTFEGITPIETSVTISFREDPEKVESTLIQLTDKLNEKYKDYLLKTVDGVIEQPFKYYGIENLNEEYQGIKYSIKGMVHSKDLEHLQRKIDREMAIYCYKNHLKTPEHNVFFKTRYEEKK